MTALRVPHPRHMAMVASIPAKSDLVVMVVLDIGYWLASHTCAVILDYYGLRRTSNDRCHH